MATTTLNKADADAFVLNTFKAEVKPVFQNFLEQKWGRVKTNDLLNRELRSYAKSEGLSEEQEQEVKVYLYGKKFEAIVRTYPNCVDKKQAETSRGMVGSHIRAYMKMAGKNMIITRLIPSAALVADTSLPHWQSVSRNDPAVSNHPDFARTRSPTPIPACIRSGKRPRHRPAAKSSVTVDSDTDVPDEPVQPPVKRPKSEKAKDKDRVEKELKAERDEDVDGGKEQDGAKEPREIKEWCHGKEEGTYGTRWYTHEYRCGTCVQQEYSKCRILPDGRPKACEACHYKKKKCERPSNWMAEVGTLVDPFPNDPNPAKIPPHLVDAARQLETKAAQKRSAAQKGSSKPTNLGAGKKGDKSKIPGGDGAGTAKGGALAVPKRKAPAVKPKPLPARETVSPPPAQATSRTSPSFRRKCEVVLPTWKMIRKAELAGRGPRSLSPENSQSPLPPSPSPGPTPSHPPVAGLSRTEGVRLPSSLIQPVSQRPAPKSVNPGQVPRDQSPQQPFAPAPPPPVPGLSFLNMEQKLDQVLGYIGSVQPKASISSPPAPTLDDFKQLQALVQSMNKRLEDVENHRDTIERAVMSLQASTKQMQLEAEDRVRQMTDLTKRVDTGFANATSGHNEVMDQLREVLVRGEAQTEFQQETTSSLQALQLLIENSGILSSSSPSSTSGSDIDPTESLPGSPQDIPPSPRHTPDPDPVGPVPMDLDLATPTNEALPSSPGAVDAINDANDETEGSGPAAVSASLAQAQDPPSPGAESTLGKQNSDAGGESASPVLPVEVKSNPAVSSVQSNPDPPMAVSFQCPSEPEQVESELSSPPASPRSFPPPPRRGPHRPGRRAHLEPTKGNSKKPASRR